MQRNQRAAQSLLILALLALAAAPAAARSLAVAPFTGSSAARQLRSEVAKVAETEFQVVPWAHSGRAEAIVAGRLIEKRSHFELILDISPIYSDRVSAKFKRTLHQSGLEERDRDALKAWLHTSMREIPIRDDLEPLRETPAGPIVMADMANADNADATPAPSAPGPRLPMEVSAGLNATAGGKAGTAASELFLKGDVFPFARLSGGKSPLRPFGLGIEVERLAIANPEGGTPTEVRVGFNAQYVYPWRRFLLLARADAFVNVLTGGSGETDVSPLLRGTLAAAAQISRLLIIGELASFSATGNSATDQAHFLPTLVLITRFTRGEVQPFVGAIFPLERAVREQVPVVVSIGLRYEPRGK